MQEARVNIATQILMNSETGVEVDILVQAAALDRMQRGLEDIHLFPVCTLSTTQYK